MYFHPLRTTWLYNNGLGRTYADVNPPAQSGWQTWTYAYDANHPHAVSSLTSGQSSVGSYQYDANGNMTCRMEDGEWFIQTYNTENRISSIIKLASPSGTCAAPGPFAAKWDFAYDGDGVRVSTLLTPYDGTGAPLTPEMTAYFFGGAYEIRNDGTNIKYYSFAGQTIAMDDGTGLQYFLIDHLGSVVATTDSTGTLISQQRYLPFGGVRPNVPTPNGPNTDLGYTGQRNLDSGIGLMDYKARFYSPYLNRFIQPDSLIPNPGNPQAWNRYSYVYNRPIILNDPTGHCPQCLIGIGLILVGAALTVHFYNETVAGYQQPGLQNEVSAAQTWQDNCMGQCHYAHAVSPTPQATVGGSRPDTPISDSIAENSFAMLNAISIVIGGAAGLTNAARVTSAARHISDDALVSVSPSKYDSSIDELGLLSSYGQESSKRIWLTKYGDIKNVTNSTDFETMLYRQSLWETKQGSFSSGATVREVMSVENRVAAGVTNKVNGVRQWFTTENIAPLNLRIIKRISAK